MPPLLSMEVETEVLVADDPEVVAMAEVVEAAVDEVEATDAPPEYVTQYEA